MMMMKMKKTKQPIVLISRQQFAEAEIAVRSGRAAFFFYKGTQLNFGVKIVQISRLFKISQRLYHWLFCAEV